MKLFSCLLLLACCIAGSVNAQLCAGSLGDPIVNFTFGNGASRPLKSGVTNMTYFSGVCPNDGQYTLASSTNGCFNNSWITVTGDHTGDRDGLFMLVNASITPNDFYVDTVTGLCSNTTFEFAAWIGNVLRFTACSGLGTKPNLTFRIETITGQELVKYNTGDIPATGQINWTQYGVFFTTPPGVSTVVLRITNNAPGGCGNDIALDDITFRPCGPVVTASVRSPAATSLEICEDDTRTFDLDAATNSGFTGKQLQWQVSTDSGTTWKDIPGANSSSFRRTPTKSGEYRYRLVLADAANFSSTQCRVASTQVLIQVNALPVPPARGNIRGCEGQGLLLTTAAGRGYQYRWTGPNGFQSTADSPFIRRTSTSNAGLYKVVITTPGGCVARDSFVVNVFPGVTASVSADTTICQGTAAQLRAGGGSVYRWTPVDGLSSATAATTLASPADTTVYQVVTGNSFGCEDSLKVRVAVLPNPVISAGPDKTIYEGEPVQLEGSVSGNYTQYSWSPFRYMNDASLLQPTVSPVDSITYFFSVKPYPFCPAVSDAVFVYVYRNLKVPNAFSPNGDGIHDTWQIAGLETYPDAVTRVFTRTGRMVYEVKGAVNWDGTFRSQPVPVATYYYVIDPKTGRPPLSGWVQVLR
jgi:gliding motility-associated-like protein